MHCEEVSSRATLNKAPSTRSAISRSSHRLDDEKRRGRRVSSPEREKGERKERERKNRPEDGGDE